MRAKLLAELRDALAEPAGCVSERAPADGLRAAGLV